MILKICEDSGPEIMNDLTGIEAAAVSRSLTSVESWFWKKTILKGFTTQRALNFKIVKINGVPTPKFLNFTLAFIVSV